MHKCLLYNLFNAIFRQLQRNENYKYSVLYTVISKMLTIIAEWLNIHDGGYEKW